MAFPDMLVLSNRYHKRTRLVAAKLACSVAKLAPFSSSSRYLWSLCPATVAAISKQKKNVKTGFTACGKLTGMRKND